MASVWPPMCLTNQGRLIRNAEWTLSDYIIPKNVKE